jgi:hypothetical protein
MCHTTGINISYFLRQRLLNLCNITITNKFTFMHFDLFMNFQTNSLTNK